VTALQAVDLRVQRGARTVLEQFQLTAAIGGMYALAGPNGAGKSTALKALAGLLPCSGQLQIAGRDLRSLSPRERARQLAYVPQQSLLQSGVGVREIVLQGRYAHDAVWPNKHRHTQPVERAMQQTDVLGLADRAWNQLSGGEQRRVLLARALATEAPVILLDEPTSSLDVAHALQLLLLLRELAEQGRCIVVVLHDLDQVVRYTDFSVLLHRGQSIAAGATKDVISSENVRRVYGVELLQNAGLGYRLVAHEGA
jgi:ABC-type cobalamin/Fe3+-siderophores transport system ATPase subunit